MNEFNEDLYKWRIKRDEIQNIIEKETIRGYFCPATDQYLLSIDTIIQAIKHARYKKARLIVDQYENENPDIAIC